MHMKAKVLLGAIGLLLTSAACGSGETWHMRFTTNWLGPMEAHFELTRSDDGLHGASLSGSRDIIASLPGEHQVTDGLVVFQAQASSDGAYCGSFLAPWQEGRLCLTVDGDSLQGSVEAGAFAGTLTGRRVPGPETIRDYGALLDSFDRVVAAKVFSPADLDTPGYTGFREIFGQIVESARDDLDVLLGFHLAWKNDPFSHFQLRRSEQTAEQMFSYFDSYRVGFDAATVDFDGKTATLKVRTMMGADTIEQIEAAYAAIAGRNVDHLVIDLRGNGGGAFAVKPLVEHVIDEPVDAGYFLSQVWNRDHDGPPTRETAMAAPPWSGWSIISFWKSVQERDILRVTFRPAEPNFDGRVSVLVDGKSASATELAADALRASGVATLVGTRTAGEMLSQSMFDVADGFVVSLPVADYFSLEHGRIEGQGVPVDVAAEPGAELETALRLAATPGN